MNWNIERINLKKQTNLIIKALIDFILYKMKKSTQTFQVKSTLIYLLFSLLISPLAFSQTTGGTTGGGTSLPAGTALPSGTNLPGGAGQTGNTQSQQGQQGANQQGQTGNTQQGNNANDGDTNNNQLESSDTEGDSNIEKDKAKDINSNVSPEILALRNKIFGYSVFADKTFEATPDKQIATPGNYPIGPLDQLLIQVYGKAELPTWNLTVSRDGYIYIPFRLGNVYVNGKTVDEVRKMLTDKLSPYVPGLLGAGGPPQTQISVTLTGLRTVKVFVTGEVINPGAYDMSSLSSAFNVLYQAGGPNEIGTFREVKVIRNNEVISKFDIYEFLTEGKLTGDVRVQENDRIVVSYYKKRVELTGEIKKPGLFEVNEGERLTNIIEYAGGFTDKAYKARVKVYRVTPKEKRILDVPFESFQNFELVTGDSIAINPILERFENLVTIDGAVMRPGEYSLDSNPTLKTLLESADGLREDAFTGRVSVTRTRQDLSVEIIPIDLADLLNGSIPDLELTRLDEVVIPSKFDMTEASFVEIHGEVINAQIGINDGKFPFKNNMSLEDLIIAAGGFKESAETTNIEIVRRRRDFDPKASNPKIADIFRVNVGRDLSMRGSQSNVILQPFDQVIVRRSPSYEVQKFVLIEGEVLVPGQYGIASKDEKISDIIQRAGGLTNYAYVPGATLKRRRLTDSVAMNNVADEELAIINKEVKAGNFVSHGSDGQVQEENIGIQLANILKNDGSSDNLIVHENDVIIIPKRLETVKVSGETLFPTTVKYGNNMNFLDYISQSGGFTKQSLRKSSFIKYPNGSVDRTRRFLVFNVYPKVEPGSEIIVPLKTGVEMTPQQAIQTGIGVTSSLLTLITTILMFRTLNLR